MSAATTVVRLEVPPLEDLMKLWEKDSVVNTADAGAEIIRIPTLHNKYNRFLSLHRLSAKKSEIKYNQVRKLKWLYYSGKLTEEELKQYDWEPFQFVLKSDMYIFLEGDDDLAECMRKKAYHDEAANFCLNVMKELNNRTWQLKEYMSWQKYEQGVK